MQGKLLAKKNSLCYTIFSFISTVRNAQRKAVDFANVLRKITKDAHERQRPKC